MVEGTRFAKWPGWSTHLALTGRWAAAGAAAVSLGGCPFLPFVATGCDPDRCTGVPARPVAAITEVDGVRRLTLADPSVDPPVRSNSFALDPPVANPARGRDDPEPGVVRATPAAGSITGPAHPLVGFARGGALFQLNLVLGVQFEVRVSSVSDACEMVDALPLDASAIDVWWVATVAGPDGRCGTSDDRFVLARASTPPTQPPSFTSTQSFEWRQRPTMLADSSGRALWVLIPNGAPGGTGVWLPGDLTAGPPIEGLVPLDGVNSIGSPIGGKPAAGSSSYWIDSTGNLRQLSWNADSLRLSAVVRQMQDGSATGEALAASDLDFWWTVDRGDVLRLTNHPVDPPRIKVIGSIASALTTADARVVSVTPIGTVVVLTVRSESTPRTTAIAVNRVSGEIQTLATAEGAESLELLLDARGQLSLIRRDADTGLAMVMAWSQADDDWKVVVRDVLIVGAVTLARGPVQQVPVRTLLVCRPAAGAPRSAGCQGGQVGRIPLDNWSPNLIEPTPLGVLENPRSTTGIALVGSGVVDLPLPLIATAGNERHTAKDMWLLTDGIFPPRLAQITDGLPR